MSNRSSEMKRVRVQVSVGAGVKEGLGLGLGLGSRLGLRVGLGSWLRLEFRRWNLGDEKGRKVVVMVRLHQLAEPIFKLRREGEFNQLVVLLIEHVALRVRPSDDCGGDRFVVQKRELAEEVAWTKGSLVK